ncbi:MAG: hypothetical protein MJ184_07910 [Treponema sp.]|uniref:hypothetical protein n=1 Tax=Treponema sp. TaxID=166 RepID=UPI00298EB495|nr:hypothetical protein [Treponema sp.]MCQ2601272.1 hypothetical protein [Treponema sp.]
MEISKREFIIDGIVNFYANNGADWASDEAIEIMSIYESDWFNLPCDSEGPSEQQWNEQNKFLDDVATKIMKLEHIFSQNYNF